MWNQFARFQNTVCNFVERWNTYNVLGKVENDNIVLTYREKCFIFDISGLLCILH